MTGRAAGAPGAARAEREARRASAGSPPGVAHEINNPLGVILGYAQLLRRRRDGAVAEDLAVIEEETLRAKEIVDGLLDLSRPLQRPSRAGRSARARATRWSRGSARRGCSTAWRSPVDGGASARATRRSCGRCSLNLVRNAAEAAGPRRRVEVRVDGRAAAARERGGARTRARGSRRERAAALFEPFFTTKAAGTGLGLAVSQAIARAHGGEHRRRMRAGGGARFTLRLPRGRAGEVVDGSARGSSWSTTRRTCSSCSREILGGRLRADDRGGRGARARARRRRSEFDVVVTDIRMPGADGFEVLARGEGARARRPRSCMMTGYATVAGRGARP